MTSRALSSLLAPLLASLLASTIAITTSDARADESAPERDVPSLPERPIKAPDAPADFLVEQHGWLRVVYHPSLFESVRHLVRDADAVRALLATGVGQSVLTHVELRVGRTPEEMAALSPLDAPPPDGARGAAYPTLAMVVLSQRSHGGDPVDLDEAFRHELAHVALFDAVAGRPTPRWLSEGFAVDVSGERTLRRAQTLGVAHAKGRLVPIDRLEAAFPGREPELRVAWAESADFVRYLRHGDLRAEFASALAAVRSGVPFERAFAESYGRDLHGLEQSWRDDVGHRYVTIPLAVVALLGWGVAVAVFSARLRKRRKLRRVEPEAPAGLEEREVVEQPEPAEPRLIVCERGAGHVLYIVEGKGVPKVEHDGKRHTLH